MPPAARTTSRWWWWKARVRGGRYAGAAPAPATSGVIRWPSARCWRRCLPCVLRAAGPPGSRDPVWRPGRVVMRASFRRRATGRLSPPSPGAGRGPRRRHRGSAAAGEYIEQVRLKSGVTLRSRVPREADAAAVLRSHWSSGPAVIAENVQDARLHGLPHPGRPEGAALRRHSAGRLAAWKWTTWKWKAPASASRFAAPSRLLLRANAIHDCAGRGAADSGPWLAVDFAQRHSSATKAPAWRRAMARGPRSPAMCSRRTRWNCRPNSSWTACATQNFLLDAEARRSAAGRQEAMIAPADRRIGKYEIRQKLGRGGMADVYLAQDTETGAHGGAEADRARRRCRHLRLPSKPNAAAPNCRRAWRRSTRAWSGSIGAGDLEGLFPRGHGVHRRAGPGRVDAPRAAGRRVRRRCAVAVARDAGERAQPGGVHRRQGIPAASCTATSSPRTSASIAAATCACSISASPRRFRCRAG